MSDAEPTTDERMRDYARLALLHSEMPLLRVSAPVGALTTEYAFWLWRAVVKQFVGAKYLAQAARDAGGWWSSAFDFVPLDDWKERFAAWVEQDPGKRG